MRWPWRLRRAIETRRAVSTRAMELETAKEILAEVFHARPGEVEEMIKSRLEERSWPEEEEAWQKDSGEGRWPATFCCTGCAVAVSLREMIEKYVFY